VKQIPKTKKIKFLSSPLARKQLLGILLFSALITLMGSSLQIYTEYRNDRGVINDKLRQIEKVHLESLTIGLWRIDNTQIQLQLNNILLLGDIVRLEIFEGGQLIFSAGPTAPDERMITQHYPMLYNNAGKQENIGELVAHASLSNVYDRLFKRTFVILATQGMQTFLVSLFILYLIYRLVIQHLLTISAYTQMLRIGALGKELTIDRKRSATAVSDEIDLLVDAINTMRRRLADDLQRRKRAERDLRMSEEKYRTLVETMPLGVQLTDREGRIIFSNPAHHRIQNREPGELVGKFIWDLVDAPADKEHTRNYYRSLLKEQPHPTTYFSKDRTKNGHLIHTQINWDYIRDEYGEVQRILSVINDISELKRLEAELLQARKMESLGTLTGGIAHDFNNILSVIIGNNELAMDDMSNHEAIRKCLKQIHFAALRAKDIVGQLLSYSRKSHQEKDTVKAATLLEDALRFLRPLIPATIKVEADIDLKEETLMGAPTQLHMALMNICVNAAQAIEETGGSIKVHANKVDLEPAMIGKHTGLQPGKHIEITIEDDGPGIPPEVMDRIFDPYFTTKAVGKGSGMGLAVVQGVVQSHGGTISVQSDHGKGTRFQLLFPMVSVEQPAEREVSRPEIPMGNERILFVDDEAAIVMMTEQMLRRLGYQVESCSHPDDALACFSADPMRFDLLITDMSMPSMSGDQLASAILTIRPGLPLILSTGYSNKLNGVSPSDLGASAILHKPFVMEKLARVVRQALDSDHR
jgi:two-component system, cell cycle sensor histidine kinase and response regulator CckA